MAARSDDIAGMLSLPQLGEGGMGLARHRRLVDTSMVIKVLLPKYAEHPTIRARFEREAQAASLLKHDNILGIVNFGTLPSGQLFLMMPFLEGKTLDAYRQASGGRLDPHLSLHFAVQLADALDYAHARGVIHRDLKPENVFVCPGLKVKLLDFGIAKLLGDEHLGPRTRTGSGLGTPSYMAVEQFQHAEEVTHLADVYALAIVIWELVTGALPWLASSAALLYHAQMTRAPERPSPELMPSAWADVLLSALSVAPELRPQSVRELVSALASALPATEQRPSGAEILAARAPHFVQRAAPHAETVCNVADIDRMPALLWLPQERQDDGSRAPAALAAQTVTRRSSTPPPSPLPTTLPGSAAGQVPSSAGRVSRWKVGLGGAAAAAVATYLVAALATRAPEPRAAVAPAAIDAADAAEPRAKARPDSPLVIGAGNPGTVPPNISAPPTPAPLMLDSAPTSASKLPDPSARRSGVDAADAASREGGGAGSASASDTARAAPRARAASTRASASPTRPQPSGPSGSSEASEHSEQDRIREVPIR